MVTQGNHISTINYSTVPFRGEAEKSVCGGIKSSIRVLRIKLFWSKS
jgi:hypothetical protein